jgi:sortase A
MVHAGEPDRKTPFSTNEPVEIPSMVLDPGRYVLRLIEPEPQRNVLEVFETVQLWSGDETRLLATVLTMANYDRPTTDKTVFVFFERGTNQPKALRTWFAPGRNYGQEFVYPRTQAVELAKIVGRAVLSMPAELPGDIGRLTRLVAGPPPGPMKVSIASTAPERPGTAPPGAIPASKRTPPPQELNAPPPQAGPAGTEVRSSAGTATTKSQARSPRPNTVADRLPQTGSYFPLVALIGLAAITAGAVFLWLSRRFGPGITIQIHLRITESFLRRGLRWCSTVGLLSIGFCAAWLGHAWFFQTFENWAFDQELQAASVPDTGFLPRTVSFATQPVLLDQPGERAFQAAVFEPADNSRVVGRLEIPRIGLKSMIVEGVSQRTLALAVGHIPGTALPGQPGNVGIAGHRDTFFRGLRKILSGDSIILKTLDGTYAYLVQSCEVVGARETRVLANSSTPELTLVTCYPFSYVGPAPDRFIVHARPPR